MSRERNWLGIKHTRPWFIRSRDYKNYEDFVLPRFRGKPTIYLEIGVFEGVSMTWMLKFVLTHPESKGIGIDPWVTMSRISNDKMDVIRERAFKNVEPYDDRCTLFRTTSDFMLKEMIERPILGVTKSKVDLCLIDGSHTPLQVLDDAISVLQLLKPGGCMMFDDTDGISGVEEGIKMFLDKHGKAVKLVWKRHTMECYQKR